MGKSRARAGFAILIVFLAGGVAGLEIKESLWPDLSSVGQLRKLDSHWASRRRAAAAGLANFPLEADTILPASPPP